MIIGRIHKKTEEVGAVNCLEGMFIKSGYIILQKQYGFAKWHYSPYQWREYLQKTAAYINEHGAEKVVDIGCGLGGLLRHLNAQQRIGMDIHEDVILAARKLASRRRRDISITYRVGTFDHVIDEGRIDYVITLGFTHGGRETTWVEPYHKIAQKNDVRHFVVDTVPEDGSSHYLDYAKILPSNYVKIECMGPFLGGRCVEIWEKR